MLGPRQQQHSSTHEHQKLVSLHETPREQAPPWQQLQGETSFQQQGGSWQQTRPHHARARRGLMGSGHQNRRAIRVKVVLTRAEAAQLLSLTAHGHRTAAQVLAELMTTRQTNTSAPPSTTTTAWRPVLESIPEE
ncbi:hypothetical protein HU200_053212 [Digitaria exilis]|uniref:Uncharacterized protein n=1 Tax=Digitaria exilis TaxID=1010633 RepID=A0A835AJU9_9POAL|nr:hypothetical protein HU200_053212 [Digitaria exilis]